MQEISSRKLNRRISLNEIAIHSREPRRRIRRVDRRVDGGEGDVAQAVERVDGLGAVGGVDDGGVFGLVVVGAAECWRKTG